MHQDTDEQVAIFDFIATGKGDLLIEALAGSGKTSTVLKSLSRIPQRSVLLTAFNKRIAEDLGAKLPPCPAGSAWHVKTFHAAGYAILKSKFRHLGGSGCVTWKATDEVIDRVANGASFPFRRAAGKILNAVKETTYAEAPERALVIRIGLDAALFETKTGTMTDAQVQHVTDIVLQAYTLSFDFMNRKTIDYPDMVWGPLVRNIAPPSRYQAVIVDEGQDINKSQLELISRLVVPGGRLILVGDRNQGIYDWRGAVPEEVWAKFDKAKHLTLTTTFRCARAIVREANELVPALQPRVGAPEGKVSIIARDAMTKMLLGPNRVDTFVLSRNNADLLTCALTLWSARVRFQLNAGKEMLEPLYIVLDGLPTHGTRDAFLAAATVWYQAETKRAEAANATAWADRVEEQFKMLTVAAAYATPSKIRGLFVDLIEPNDSGVLLSTVHKVKGLEADRVFLLRDTFERHKPRTWPDGKAKPPIDQEELNIEYVAITRAKSELFWVTAK